MPRIKALILTTGAVAIAALATACSSSTGTTASASTTSAATAAASPTGGARGAVSTCLQAHGVPKGALASALSGFGGGTPSAASTSAATNQTLRAAGIACQASVPPATASTLLKLDTCVAGHGVSTADTGSALADILLLDLSDPTVHSAMSTCLTQLGIAG